MLKDSFNQFVAERLLEVKKTERVGGINNQLNIYIGQALNEEQRVKMEDLIVQLYAEYEEAAYKKGFSDGMQLSKEVS